MTCFLQGSCLNCCFISPFSILFFSFVCVWEGGVGSGCTYMYVHTLLVHTVHRQIVDSARLFSNRFYPSVSFTCLILCRIMGGPSAHFLWTKIVVHLGQVTSWTSSHAHAYTRASLEMPVHLTCMVLVCGWKWATQCNLMFHRENLIHIVYYVQKYPF